MKPLNHDDPGCNYTSSNCVKWQGADIPCIKLCKGDSISEVVEKLATELCDVLDTLDIDKYDLSCLNITSCAPKDFHEFIQLMINTICELQAGGGSTTITTSSSSRSIPVAPCFYYKNELGDQVTTMTVEQYVTAIGNRICGTTDRVSSVETTVAVHTEQIDNLNQRVSSIPTDNTNLIIPVCVAPAVPTDPNVVLGLLEEQFCELVSATGTASDIYQSILKQCVGLGADKTLGGGGGTMASLPGWDNNLLTMAGAFNNIWITLCDIRSAIKNIQFACCAQGCDGVELNLNAVLDTNNIIMYINGNIPSGFANCTPSGSLVSISDNTGGSFTTYVDLVTFLNNPSGFVVSLTGTPINLASDIHIQINTCLNNSSTGANCQSLLNYTIANANCPNLVYTPTTDSIGYSGASLAGTNTYTVQLYNNAGTMLIASQVQIITSPTLVSGTFSGLTINSLYRARVIVTPAAGPDTVCPFVPVALVATTLTPITLGTTDSFSVLAGTGVNNLGATSSFIGNVGSDPTVTITGIAPADVTGVLYTVSDPVVVGAQVDLTNAINDATARTPVTAIPSALAGTVITPGYYATAGNIATNTANVTFDGGGDPNAIFVIKATTSLTTSAASTMTLINGASFNNIFWLVGTASIGDTSTVSGTILASGDVTVNSSDIHGRILSKGRVDFTNLASNVHNV